MRSRPLLARSLSTLLAAALALSALPGAAMAQEPAIPGWETRGTSADATMERGQIFRCTDASCAEDVSCLYAAAPPRPAGARWLKIEDVVNPDVWPWSQIETWLGIKLNEMRSGLVDDPFAPSRDWASADEPATFTLGENGFARRVYGLKARSAGDVVVPMYFWTSKGRLFSLFCLLKGRSLSSVRAPVHALLEALHPGEPVRDDIPTRF